MPFISRLRALFKTQSRARSERQPHRCLSPFNQKGGLRGLLRSLDVAVRVCALERFLVLTLFAAFGQTQTSCLSSTPTINFVGLDGDAEQTALQPVFPPRFATNEFIYRSVFCFIRFTGIPGILKGQRPSFTCFIMPLKSPQPVVRRRSAPLLSPLLVSCCNLSSYFLMSSRERLYLPDGSYNHNPPCLPRLVSRAVPPPPLPAFSGI